MAQIPNLKAITEGDGLNDYLNLDTVNKLLQLPNGAILKLYSDAYTTLTAQLGPGGVASAQSATALALATNGAIPTAGIGVSRINAGASVTGITMQAGTLPGQECWVINEDVVGHTITFNTTPATALVANSATASAIAGLTARKFVWDSGTSLWYATVGT